ncbi:MAG TPA: DNA mismatch repair protein MutS [Acidobacteria bacterium]|nr:DNA mismatch repair protein MutS [Acidobacteriota bacterium]
MSTTTPPARDPPRTYERLLDELRREEAALARRADRVSTARLATFAVGALLAWGTVFGDWMSSWWLSLPVIVFIGLVVVHDRVLAARDKVSRAVAWYEHGIARLEDRWCGIGARGDRFVDADHLFAEDLDLFGEASLFQLLSTAQTQAGEDTLASWLREPADRTEVTSRQAAVRDLLPRLELRERLATAGAEMRATVHLTTLSDWATAPPVLHATWPRVVALALSGLTVAAIVAWGTGTTTSLPMLLALFAMVAFAVSFRGHTRVMHAADGPARELAVLGGVCRVLREDVYASPRLSALRAALDTTAGEVHQVARRLERLVEFHDWQHNFMFRPVAALLLWELHCAFAVESWRARYGAAVPEWLRHVGEFEALAALGTYAYEHPADVYPELVDVDGPPVYEAEALAHPLIPTAVTVANDVTLGADPQVLIVSGSNMSGKTTLLRSVGVSTVMALMGAPVRARRLRLSPVALGATLRIEDSLQAGRSRFYSEVLRLGQIVTLARAGPTLFLLDELFHGTNSHDRTEGARGLLRSLVSLGAVGLVTTHDLALAEIANRMAPAARNVHFDDSLVAGKMRFDYRLKPGPVTRSNALAIMRAVGLEVTATEDGSD